MQRLLRDPGTDSVRAAALLFLVTASALPLWLLGGLETVMVAALLMGGVACLIPALTDTDGASRARPLLGGILLGCATLTRPDAVVASFACIAGMVVLGPGTLAQRLRLAEIATAGAAFVVVPHLAWRYSYYGDLLPNTYYAKVGVPVWIRLPNGLPYLLRALVDMPPLLIAGLLFVEAALKRSLTPTMTWLAGAIGLHILYVLWAGGDHMPGARLMLPVVGLAVVLAALLLAALPDADRIPRLAGGVAAALLCLALFPQQAMDRAAFEGGVVGRHLNATEKPGTLVALNTAGSTPYYAPDLRYIDMLGLVDHTIARRNPVPFLTWRQNTAGHSKGDGLYVLSRKPDIILLGGAAGETADNPWFLSDVEIVASPEFKRCYKLESIGVGYDDALAQQSPVSANPLPLDLYRRTCRD